MNSPNGPSSRASARNVLTYIAAKLKSRFNTMSESSGLSRREFIRNIPKYLTSGLHSLTREFSGSNDTDTEDNQRMLIDDNSVKIASIDTNNCLAWDGGSCQFCYLACPLRDQAITIEDQRPLINSTICDGCAKCLTACKTINTSPAILMVAAH